MDLKEVFKLAWENRQVIAEGLYNTYLSHDKAIKEEAARRKYICETNGVCGGYDPEGKPETSAVPGQPACRYCHCNIIFKSACMSCHCSLKDQGKEPLWDAIMTPEQEREIGQKIYENQPAFK